MHKFLEDLEDPLNRQSVACQKLENIDNIHYYV